MARKTHHVVPGPSGGWNVKAGGSERASKHFETKREAENYGRGVSQRAGSEFIIHGLNGQIQRADSHGGDPQPPRDSR
jgi:hypothetical protein